MARVFLTLGLALLAGCAGMGVPGPVTGRWVTQSGQLEVEISPCDQALCGTVVRVTSADDDFDAGAPGRSVLGRKLLEEFTARGEGRWEGRIYNRGNGKTYDCILTLVGRDEIEVRPYVLAPLFGETQIWRRVAAAK